MRIEHQMGMIGLPTSWAIVFGLEQAVFLYDLSRHIEFQADRRVDGAGWASFTKSHLMFLYPYWTEQRLDELLIELKNKKLIQMLPDPDPAVRWFAVEEAEITKMLEDAKNERQIQCEAVQRRAGSEAGPA